MATDVVKLLGEGVPIRLKDGNTYQLLLNARAVALLEREYGSIAAYSEALSGPVVGVDSKGQELRDPMRGQLLNTVITTMRVGLARSNGLRPDEIEDLVDLKHLALYLDAITEAFNQAMPDASEDEAPVSGKGSPGVASTRSRSSSTGARMTSSGT